MFVQWGSKEVLDGSIWEVKDNIEEKEYWFDGIQYS